MTHHLILIFLGISLASIFLGAGILMILRWEQYIERITPKPPSPHDRCPICEKRRWQHSDSDWNYCQRLYTIIHSA